MKGEMTKEDVQKYLTDISYQSVYWDEVLDALAKKNAKDDIRWLVMEAFIYGRIRGQQMERQKQKKENAGSDTPEQ